jgi:hypothetical protein
MPFGPPVYANEIRGDGSAGFGSVFNREDDITVISQCGRVDPTVRFDDIALSPHNMVALDVCNKLVEIHLISAGRRHEGRSRCNFAGVHDQYMCVTGAVGFKGKSDKWGRKRSVFGSVLAPCDFAAFAVVNY